MNNVYKPRLKTGARVRVLATNELGTIADKQLIRKNGQTKVYCNVRLDKRPDQDIWYFAEKLGDTKECAFVTFGDHTERRIIVGVEIDHEKDCVSGLKVKGLPDEPDRHEGLYKYLAAIFLNAFKESRPCHEKKQ